jgi:chemotaxis protein CheD
MIILGVGDLGITNIPGECIKTYALGSCLAVILLHPPSKTIGMVHIALWDSGTNPGKALTQPGFFADTGVQALLRCMEKKAVPAREFKQEIVVKIAGGANIMNPHDPFKIGQRNLEAVKRILSSLCLSIKASDVGGQISRTVSVFVDNGSVILSSPSKKDWRI